MTAAEFVLDGQLPDLNEWRDELHKSPHAGNRVTRDNVRRVAKAAMAQLLPRFERRADFYFLWTEPNRRRDPDNIQATGVKFILDGLVRAGVLPDDGPRYVGRIFHEEVVYDPMNVGVAVYITDERYQGDADGA